MFSSTVLGSTYLGGTFIDVPIFRVIPKISSGQVADASLVASQGESIPMYPIVANGAVVGQYSAPTEDSSVSTNPAPVGLVSEQIVTLKKGNILD